MTIVLAYNDTELITDVKCFIVQAPGGLPQRGVWYSTKVGSSLAYKYKTRVEVTDSDKRSSLQ
jgi:hypothetical protein